VPVTVGTSRLSCGNAGKARILTPVWESSGESRLSVVLRRVQVLVRDNNVDQALRVLKKKIQREGPRDEAPRPLRVTL
jgi:hypothetical protein